MSTGFLITIEGIDGSGKSTLGKLLQKELISKKQDILLTQEPGRTELGQKIRTILHEEKDIVGDKAEFLLFAANRAQHFEEIVTPALKQGKIVISDRMADSSVAYQGYGRGLDIEKIKYINSWCMDEVKPDMTLYLEIDEKTALERVYKRKEALTDFEKEKSEFWKRVQKGFEEIFKKRDNVIFLDGTLQPKEIANRAMEAILKLIKL